MESLWWAVLRLFAGVAVVAVLAGCGGGDVPSARLAGGSHEEPGAAVGGSADRAVVDDSDGDAGVGEDSVVSSRSREVEWDPEWDPFERDRLRDAQTSDDGRADDDAGMGGDGVVEHVGDGVGGVLVQGPCGWPGPLCAADEDVVPLEEGGSLWWSEKSGWESWVGKVVDWCDDYEALAAIEGDRLYPFGGSIDDIDDIDVLGRVFAQRESQTIVCSEADAATPRWKCWNGGLSELQAYLAGFAQPPASSDVVAWAESEGLDCFDATARRRRYSYVTVDGPMPPRASVEEAVAAYRRRVEQQVALPGNALGLLDLGWGFVVESPRDALVVLKQTVSVLDGVVRGLAQNQSERLWARDVAVTATDPEGSVGLGHFALAVQPGEVLPFEIEGWDGTDDPFEIGFEVTAGLSPRIDLSRSLKLSWTKYWVDEAEFLQLFPEEMAPWGIPEGYFDFVEVIIERQAPTAHPRLAEAAREQTIENLTVLAAVFRGGSVFDVVELIPMEDVSSPSEPAEWVEVAGIPEELPNGRITTAPTVGVVASLPLIWAGSAAGGAAPPEVPPRRTPTGSTASMRRGVDSLPSFMATSTWTS